jgi:hypothetical protein
MKKNTLHTLLIVIVALAIMLVGEGCATYQHDTGCPLSQGIIGTDATWHPVR